MAKRIEISIETRSAIITLRKEGYSLRNIARKLKVSYKGVLGTVTRFADIGSLKDKPRSGRPKITSRAEDVRINIIYQRNRRLTTSEIRVGLNDSRPNPISLTTVKRRLRAAGLNGRIAVRKPLLSSKNQCIVPTVKHGSGSVMIWGCFSTVGVGDLIKIEHTMKKEDYKQILEQHALPSGHQLIGRNFIMQQDNDPKHSSKLYKGFLLQKKTEASTITGFEPDRIFVGRARSEYPVALSNIERTPLVTTTSSMEKFKVRNTRKTNCQDAQNISGCH
ncbi:PREDICTED: uncharacterized protein LOC108572315 [Habropoda laboriosa]|uniref:uncharacterized protein LOC108572315 n=1 Tax=Habropoda laboriosa TaxID=597456 RepID=UPI00083E36E4|nr:PREDICTED: uncharacterized protein LOC108572315 [Habropoda laboriosa]